MLEIKSKKKDPRIIESDIEFPEYPEITDIDTGKTFFQNIQIYHKIYKFFLQEVILEKQKLLID